MVCFGPVVCVTRRKSVAAQSRYEDLGMSKRLLVVRLTLPSFSGTATMPYVGCEILGLKEADVGIVGRGHC
jgi:hypothetical protein